MIRSCLATASLLLAAMPALAQPSTKPLAPSDVLGAAKTIQFKATVFRKDKLDEIYTVALSQPNKIYVGGVDTPSNTTDYTAVCNGKELTVYDKNSHAARATYRKLNPLAHLVDASIRDFPMSLFLNPVMLTQFHQEVEQPGVYRRTLVGEPGTTQTEILSLDALTGLPKTLSFVTQSGAEPEQSLTRIVFSDWKLNAPISNSRFAYTPPVDASVDTSSKLLADGTTAPDFTVEDKDGKAVKLSDYKGKTVLLDFWSTWCGPCQMSLPHTTALARQYADKNVVVLAVNVWDTSAAFQSWLPKCPQYSALNFAIDTKKINVTALYGVSGIPTQYVIDPAGKIITSIVGYDPSSTQVEDALAVSRK